MPRNFIELEYWIVFAYLKNFLNTVNCFVKFVIFLLYFRHKELFLKAINFDLLSVKQQSKKIEQS